MVLTYVKGSFNILKNDEPFTRYPISTKKAVVKYREFADSKAKRILDRILVKNYDLPKTMPKLSFLDAHQVEGVKWILTRSRSYLAHAPGAGKTAQAIIASILCAGPGQVLFIVPPTLTINWLREVEKFKNLLALELNAGVKASLTAGIVPLTEKQDQMNWQHPIVICPDSMLTKPWVLERLINMKKRFVAVDEASRFKEPYAQRSIALFGGHTSNIRSPGICYDARHVVLLDGSPMPNRPMELWAPTFALCPEAIDFMTESDFGFRYCGAKLNDEGKWEFRGSANEDELKERIQKSFMHVVTEDKLEHPERLRTILTMNTDPRSPELKTWEKKNIDSVVTLFKSNGEYDERGAIARHRRELGLSKVDWVVSYIKERLERKNESLLVFAWHREVCEGIALGLKKYKPYVVIGGVKNSDREKAFDDFQKSRCRVIIGNIAAMGRGHNLQRADRVIFAEYAWGDELNKQCEKRASRRGRDQERSVRCEYIACPQSMDEPILKALFRKEALTHKVIG